MAYGIQVYHQVVPAQVAALAQRLGLDLPNPSPSDDPWDWREEYIDPIADAVAAPLHYEHLELVRRHFDPFATAVDHYHVAHTLAGKRQFAPFCFTLAGDLQEIGDDWPGGFIFGVTIATRYKPTWMDWKEEHGVHQYEHVAPMYQYAADAIGRAVPELQQGMAAVRFEHF